MSLDVNILTGIDCKPELSVMAQWTVFCKRMSAACGRNRLLIAPELWRPGVQASSYGETLSTLGFGARVSQISLGAARNNVESGAVFDAREAASRYSQVRLCWATATCTFLFPSFANLSSCPSDTVQLEFLGIQVTNVLCHDR